jgi:hypothetical protein
MGRASRIVLPDVMDGYVDGVTMAESIAGAESVVFDFDRVRRITSFGAREWIRLLERIPKETYYCFIRCRPSVVLQLSSVENFAGRGELVSLYVPYACPSCSHGFEILVDLAAEKERFEQKLPPPMKCPKCHREAEFDEVAEIYFDYAASCAPASPPDAVKELILESVPDSQVQVPSGAFTPSRGR